MIFKLREIITMKMKLVGVLTREIDLAISKGWKYHAEACRKELEKVKYDIQHPEEVQLC